MSSPANNSRNDLCGKETLNYNRQCGKPRKHVGNVEKNKMLLLRKLVEMQRKEFFAD